MELAEIYSRAADYIEEHGWCQNLTQSPITGHVCLYGGLLQASTSDLDIYCSAGRALQHLTDELGWSPIAWNDTPGRTKEEVIAFLRKQAIKAGLTVPATHIIEIPEPEPLELPVQPEVEPVEEPDLVPA